MGQCNEGAKHGSTARFCNKEDGWKLLAEDAQKGLQWVLKYLLEIVYAMEYLQSQSVIHGDLKCANVLLKSSTSDFRGFTCKCGILYLLFINAVMSS